MNRTSPVPPTYSAMGPKVPVSASTACPAKPTLVLTPTRKTLASTSTSNVFQSFGLKAVDGGRGNIDTNGGWPLPRAPPPGPRRRGPAPAAEAAARFAAWPPERVSGSRLRETTLRIDRDRHWRRRPPASVV